MTIIKTFKHKYCLNLGTCHKYIVQFTDPTSTIFLNVKRAKLINPIKTMFVFLAVFQTQCIIYRPELHNSQASRKMLKSS